MSKKPELPGYDPLEWLKEGESPPAEVSAPQSQTAAEEEIEEAVADEAETSQPAVAEMAAAQESTEPSSDDNPVADDDTTPLLDLEGSLQIMDVATLQPRMQDCLDRLKKITLRADNQIIVDAAGMQLLLAFVQQAQQEAVELQWEELPAAIAEAARLLGAEQLLLKG